MDVFINWFTNITWEAK